MKDAKKRTFLITGAGAGFGRAFAEAALDAGHTVVGTVRREDQRVAFEALHGNGAHGVVLDVAHFDAIEPTVRKIEEQVGPIDGRFALDRLPLRGSFIAGTLRPLHSRIHSGLFQADSDCRKTLNLTGRNLRLG